MPRLIQRTHRQDDNAGIAGNLLRLERERSEREALIAALGAIISSAQIQDDEEEEHLPAIHEEETTEDSTTEQHARSVFCVHCQSNRFAAPLCSTALQLIAPI